MFNKLTLADVAANFPNPDAEFSVSDPLSIARALYDRIVIRNDVWQADPDMRDFIFTGVVRLVLAAGLHHIVGVTIYGEADSEGLLPELPDEWVIDTGWWPHAKAEAWELYTVALAGGERLYRVSFYDEGFAYHCFMHLTPKGV